MTKSNSRPEVVVHVSWRRNTDVGVFAPTRAVMTLVELRTEAGGHKAVSTNALLVERAAQPLGVLEEKNSSWFHHVDA
jgi:hypothetical protein